MQWSCLPPPQHADRGVHHVSPCGVAYLVLKPLGSCLPVTSVGTPHTQCITISVPLPCAMVSVMPLCCTIVEQVISGLDFALSFLRISRCFFDLLLLVLVCKHSPCNQTTCCNGWSRSEPKLTGGDGLDMLLGTLLHTYQMIAEQHAQKISACTKALSAHGLNSPHRHASTSLHSVLHSRCSIH